MLWADNSRISHYVAPSYSRPNRAIWRITSWVKVNDSNLMWESPGSVYICVLWNHAVEKMIVVIGRILISINSGIYCIVYISVSHHYRVGLMEAFGYQPSKREYNWNLTTWLKCYKDDIMPPLFQCRPGSWKSGLFGLDVGGATFCKMQELLLIVSMSA